MPTETANQKAVRISQLIRQIDVKNDARLASIESLRREIASSNRMRIGAARGLNLTLQQMGHGVDERVELDGHIWQVADGEDSEIRYIGADFPDDSEDDFTAEDERREWNSTYSDSISTR